MFPLMDNMYIIANYTQSNKENLLNAFEKCEKSNTVKG